MKRAWAAGIAVLVALAATVGIAVGSGSGPPLRLAYVTGTATSAAVVRLANADGTGARALGPGAQPLLAPDGSLVAASSGNALVVYPAGGGAPHRYFGAADATALAVAFSPDSRYIAVVLSSTDPASVGSSGLAVIDTSTFGQRMIVRGQIDGASFAPDGSDRIAYASAASAALTAPVDVHVIGADGSGEVQITHDGQSLNPVWGPGGIAFDYERLRADAEPAYELWMMASDGSGRRPLGALRIPPLREGLVPVGFSDDGSVLLAEYEGQDTSEAWVLRLPAGRPAPLGAELTGAALSGDGARALVDRGGFLLAPDEGAVESLALHGGAARILVAHGSEPSWNE
ncbi:MAG: TolB family protein [Solirubrobacteraceae bacterium]